MPTTNRSSSATSKSSETRSANKARDEAIAMLKEDHKRVKKAFKEFEKLEDSEDQQVRQALVERTCAELTIHAMLEEEIFYPAARNGVKEEDLIEEAEVEHASAKQLIEQLKQMEPDDPKYAATFTVLGEYVEHHVKEEENEMFPQVSKSKEIEWESICEQMTARRTELMEQMLPAEDGEETKGSH
ncbi:MAG TPA: hemerythrin domain-containing protein [Methylibium sp.]|uniref:hemerythrin domain-containing protein n=1 Tax=Methylibium sp. TaxID=2067992 RepID=UPI002DB94FEC|nr:hemerythrin domain-containing protein [Methylibium sp.]HEU4459099.1 hemerythrin domain-containing protein [Methylibium sp.]